MYQESSVSSKLNYACFISNYSLKAGVTIGNRYFCICSVFIFARYNRLTLKFWSVNTEIKYPMANLCQKLHCLCTLRLTFHICAKILVELIEVLGYLASTLPGRAITHHWQWLSTLLKTILWNTATSYVKLRRKWEVNLMFFWTVKQKTWHISFIILKCIVYHYDYNDNGTDAEPKPSAK